MARVWAPEGFVRAISPALGYPLLDLFYGTADVEKALRTGA